MNSWIFLLILIVVALQAYQWYITSSTSSSEPPSSVPIPTTLPSSEPTSMVPSSLPSSVPTMLPASAPTPSVAIRFESLGENKRTLELNFETQKVVLDGLDGAILYSSMIDTTSLIFYLFINGTLFEFKYQSDARVGFLIQHQFDFDSVCVFRLI